MIAEDAVQEARVAQALPLHVEDLVVAVERDEVGFDGRERAEIAALPARVDVGG